MHNFVILNVVVHIVTTDFQWADPKWIVTVTDVRRNILLRFVNSGYIANIKETGEV